MHFSHLFLLGPLFDIFFATLLRLIGWRSMTFSSVIYLGYFHSAHLSLKLNPDVENLETYLTKLFSSFISKVSSPLDVFTSQDSFSKSSLRNFKISPFERVFRRSAITVHVRNWTATNRLLVSSTEV